ncbi:hypothetical protein KO504_05330 [Winogradskyella psychrotolerans]|uniref:hypothetical protein n=1 Tax=Winogradskyella psychrotolerans TaxID=1344585 RepID=UPI001C06895D|nr:hypothetical protein [Winogradskyella psychrotolerans]MBU2920753.1 hypothetical protein [Winogradskyella psychrotolerans]
MIIETVNFWKINTIKISFIALSFSVLLGCKAYQPTKELQAVFNLQELKDLETIRTFFIKDIMDLKEEDFHLTFRSKIERLEASGFATISPKKIKQLFNSISKSTFDEIWEIKKQKRSRNNEGSYEYFVPKRNSKYYDFLNRVTEHNSMVKQYYDTTIKAGDFNHSSMLKYTSDNTLDFDLKNTNVQIVMAIHYISICYENNIANQLIY